MDNASYEKEGDGVNPKFDSEKGDFDKRSLSAGDIESIQEHKTLGQKFREYPKCIFFIFGNEFCERFSYYGMLSVLTLYAINILQFSDARASTLFNGFSALCYFTPILGCILADGYIGKFHTILWVSLLYAAGNIILAVAAVFKDSNHSIHPALDYVALIVIGFGTGGIKPCVSAFGGDQFSKGQEKWLETFFSIFYFAINAGSCISTFITPIFRTRHCLGQQSCYPLAFGVPAVLMVVSCFFFVFGSFWYRKVPPKENVLAICSKVVIRAVRNKFVFSIQRDHWLDHYLDDHSCTYDPKCVALGSCEKKQFCKDLASVFRILVIYIPTPFFWALYNQNGSTWIIQGTQMNGRMGSVTILPDQVPTINPILIMAFIPIFSGILYPLTAKCFKVTPLRKMSVGGILAALSYVITGFLQLEVNKSLPYIPPGGMSSIRFMNSEPCDVNINAWGPGWSQNFTLGADKTSDRFNFNAGLIEYEVYQTNASQSCNLPTKPINGTMTKSKHAYYSVIAEGHSKIFNESTQKPTLGQGQCLFSFNWFIPNYPMNNATYLLLCAPSDFSKANSTKGCINQTDQSRFQNVSVSEFNATQFLQLNPDRTWYMYFPSPTNEYKGFPTEPDYNISFNLQGAIHTVTIYGDDTEHAQVNETELTAENHVPVLYQMPQYFVSTASEILFSITGLEFSYSQAPLSMKSVLQAVWLITIALGNIIIIIIVDAQFFTNMAYTFFLFAGMMMVVMVVFILLAMFYYEYVYFIRDEDEEEGVEKTEMKE